MEFSIINQPFLDTPIYGNLHIPMGGFIMAPAKHARVWPGAQSEPTALRLSQFFRVAMGDNELSKFEGNT